MSSNRIRHHAPSVPSGCRWCGDEQYHHGLQYVPGNDLHGYVEPTQAQRLARMKARRSASKGTS